MKNRYLLAKGPYFSNLRKIFLETILSSAGAGFSIATINIFWNSIGMNQEDIGFVQMIFTIVIGVLDIPMGYVADRFNKKILNIGGDIGVAFTFILYAFSQNIYMTILSESLLGVFTSMTSGVDQSFLKANCDKIDSGGSLFKEVNVQLYTAKYTLLLSMAFVGGFIAKYSIRLCIGISFVPYILAGLVAIFIKDYTIRYECIHKSPIKDMIYMLKTIILDKNIRIYLLSYIFSREITHSQIWVFTPLLLMCKIKIEYLSLGWILSYFMQIIGGMLAQKFIHLKTSKKFILPILLEITWMMVLVINTNIVTVWLFALNGLVQGLLGSNMMTALQESAKNEIQTSLISVASTGSRIIYIPLVYIINYLGNIKLEFSFLGVIFIFAPICLVIYSKLKKAEKSSNN